VRTNFYYPDGYCCEIIAAVTLRKRSSQWLSTMTSKDSAISRTYHVGESCAFADGPGVWPITLGQRQRTDALGWTFTTLDAALSPERQANHIIELIERDVDALTSFTLDADLAEPVYAAAAEAAIPVVTFGTASPSALTTIRQRVDSGACAADAAAYLASRIPRARTLVIGGPPIPALAARTVSFLEAAAKAGLKIVAREDNVGDIEETARPIAAGLLDTHPDIEAIWCFNDYTALAAGKELQRRRIAVQCGSRPGVIVSGIGGIPAMIDAIRQGLTTFTYDSRPVDAGRAAIDAIERFFVRDERPPPEIWIDFARHDLANVGDYVPWSGR
jgi:ribose transport system substrate-binding protein